MAGLGGSATQRQQLLAIWRDVLDQPELAAADNFFASGGHSVHAVALVNRVNEAFGLKLGLVQLFEHPSVDELAAAIEAIQATAR